MPTDQRTMIVPKPAFVQGDRIEVLNYRRRPAAWESGELVHVSGELDRHGRLYWLYTVRIYKADYRVTVRGDSVRAEVADAD